MNRKVSGWLAAGIIAVLIVGAVAFAVASQPSPPSTAQPVTKTTRYHSISCGKIYDVGEEPTAADEAEFKRCTARAKAHEEAYGPDPEPIDMNELGDAYVAAEGPPRGGSYEEGKQIGFGLIGLDPIYCKIRALKHANDLFAGTYSDDRETAVEYGADFYAGCLETQDQFE